jgi:hypothetical protein
MVHMPRLSPSLLLSGSLVRAQQAEPNSERRQGATPRQLLYFIFLNLPQGNNAESVGHLQETDGSPQPAPLIFANLNIPPPAAGPDPPATVCSLLAHTGLSGDDLPETGGPDSQDQESTDQAA